MKLRRRLRLGTILLVSLLMAVLFLDVDDGSSSTSSAISVPPDGIQRRGNPPRADYKRKSTTSPHLSSRSTSTSAEPFIIEWGRACEMEFHRARRRAEALARECAPVSGDSGLCIGPVPFEHERQAESQVANALSHFAPCGLDASNIQFDCSENPCATIIPRAAILNDQTKCTALATLRARLPEIDRELPPEGVWADYMPLVLDEPTDIHAILRARWRFEARRAALARRLEDPAQQMKDECARVRRILDAFDSTERCEALRDWWDCPESVVRLPPGTLDRYTDHAVAIVEALDETCPAFFAANRVLDCSAPPCILLVDRAPNQPSWDVTCGPRFKSVIQKTDHIAIWLFADESEPGFADLHALVEERFAYEMRLRYESAMDLLVQQRELD